MAGDFSRWRLDWATNYQALLMQQGRVTLDADWNAYALARDERQRREILDLIGPAAGPKADAGFEIAASATQLTIGPGRYYVAGVACDLAASGEPLSWTQQPFMPAGSALPTEAGEYLAYLDVWPRVVDALQDPQLAEVALGGPDTVVGLQQLWQVKLAGPGVPDPWPAPQFSPLMQARVENSLGLGNWLYRIEVHYGSGENAAAPFGTFKWSRKNASVSAGIVGWSAATITLAPGPATLEVLFQVGNWVEFIDDDIIFGGIAAPLWQVAAIDATANTITVVVASGRTPPVIDPKRHPLLRRWDQGAIASPNLIDGTIPIAPGSWMAIEDGIQIQFRALTPPLPPSTTGDFWSFVSRTATGAIDWPADDGMPRSLPKLGIWHHYAPLALVATNGESWKFGDDRRTLFAPIGEVAQSIQDLQRRLAAREAEGVPPPPAPPPARKPRKEK